MDRLKFLGKEIRSFNIEATNWCYLKCSACDRTIRKDHVKKRNDLDISIFKKLANYDLIHEISFNFCGIYGDNLYHPEIIDIFKILKSKGSRVTLETNGSYRDDDFWKELLNTLDEGDIINFSIDGLEDTNKIYRKGSSWKHIYKALKMAGKSKVKADWKFIVFKHNQHQIKEARELAEKLGVNFYLRYSGRFLENDPLLPDPEFIGLQQKHRTFVENAYKNNTVDNNVSILPRCIDGKNIGITNEGLVLPCLTFHSIKNEWMEENREKISLFNRDISDILNDPLWEDLSNMWETPTKAPYICSKYCGMPKTELNKFEPSRIKASDYNYD